MAIKKIRMRPEGGNDYEDVLHPETSADMVLSGDGTIQSEVEQVKSNLSSHKADNANPHGITKTQIGLGSVQNYGIATKAEAEAGTSNVKYTTPLGVKAAVDAAIMTSRFSKSVYAGTGTSYPLFEIPLGKVPKKYVMVWFSKAYSSYGGILIIDIPSRTYKFLPINDSTFSGDAMNSGSLGSMPISGTDSSRIRNIHIFSGHLGVRKQDIDLLDITGSTLKIRLWTSGTSATTTYRINDAYVEVF